MENLTFAPGLPERCYLISPLTGRIVEVHRGESCFCGVSASAGQIADGMNAQLGVTAAQSAAMLGGVLYGWNSRHADPASYTETGFYTGPDEPMKGGF